MSAIKATWKHGQIVPDGPVSWREGSRLVIHEEAPAAIQFMTEEEQGDDPESIQRWIDELRAIPPLPMPAEEEAEMIAWQQKLKEFNVEAVRRQMEEGRPVIRRYLLDTGPAFDVLFHRKGVDLRAESARRGGAKVGICLPVLGEIIAGLEGSDSREASWEIAHRTLGKLVCWPFDKAAAYEFGRLFAQLKRLGRPMQQIDIQIAAIALTLDNCTVVSADSDLAAVPGLTVDNWAV